MQAALKQSKHLNQLKPVLPLYKPEEELLHMLLWWLLLWYSFFHSHPPVPELVSGKIYRKKKTQSIHMHSFWDEHKGSVRQIFP